MYGHIDNISLQSPYIFCIVTQITLKELAFFQGWTFLLVLCCSAGPSVSAEDSLELCKINEERTSQLMSYISYSFEILKLMSIFHVAFWEYDFSICMN
jgi:hypothetical protein